MGAVKANFSKAVLKAMEKAEAEKKGIKMPKLYYALEKIRARLLQCIGQTMKREGWSDA